MTGQQVPTFNIVSVGMPKSGKTLYLGALYEVIGVKPLAPGIRFSVTPKDRGWLTDIYDYMKSAEHPELSLQTTVGTGVREVIFRCSVFGYAPNLVFGRKGGRRPYDAFRINYADYAGEWISDGYKLEDQGIPDDFSRKIADAHMLLGVIDGELLLNQLTGKGAQRDYFRRNLRPIVSIMHDHPVPAHLIITKWDLLSEYGLARVAQFLLDSSQETGFQALYSDLSSRNQVAGELGQIRLIPVSATGGFARRQPDGQMRKVPGGNPAPFNVDIPLVAAIVDICEMVHRVNREQERQARQDRAEGRAKGNTGTATLSFKIGSLFEADLTAVAAFIEAGGKAGAEVGRQAATVGRVVRRQFRRVNAKGLTGVRSREGAVFYVARAFHQRLAEYEAEPPEYQPGRPETDG
jgi:hypothetical protein